LTTQLKLITTSDQVNITTNPKGEKAAAKGFPFSFSFLFFFFSDFILFLLSKNNLQQPQQTINSSAQSVPASQLDNWHEILLHN